MGEGYSSYPLLGFPLTSFSPTFSIIVPRNSIADQVWHFDQTLCQKLSLVMWHQQHQWWENSSWNWVGSYISYFYSTIFQGMKGKNLPLSSIFYRASINVQQHFCLPNRNSIARPPLMFRSDSKLEGRFSELGFTGEWWANSSWNWVCSFLWVL